MPRKLICYCFGFAEDDIREDVRRYGRSTIMAKIMADKKAGVCRCAETNPAGR